MTVHDVAAALRDIPGLREMCRSIAMAEAVLSPCDYKCYSLDVRWSESEEAFSMRSGSGDEFADVFSLAGAYIRGFDHESPMSPNADDVVWPGVLHSVPGPSVPRSQSWPRRLRLDALPAGRAHS